MITPLYEHDNSDNAYVSDNYPYGNLRCKIKFWLEKKSSKGFRFVSQTQNPKTGHWNNPRQGTYSRLAACLYMDDNHHIQCKTLTEYSSEQDVLEFIENFPKADLDNLLPFSLGKKLLCLRTIEGKPNFTIAGQPQLPTETEIIKARVELEVWDKCLTLLKQYKQSPT